MTEKKDIMRVIYKYKAALLLLFSLLSGAVNGQQPVIDSMEYTVYDPQYFFACRKATAIDLFKASNLYVSPENGYWGDALGVPYNGKPGVSPSKERQYTSGNIFTPPVAEADTGMYRFYFYFTSPKDYCGIKTGTRFILNLYLGSYGCLQTISGELDNDHKFCYGNSTDLGARCHFRFSPPITVENLLFTCAEDQAKWKKDRSMNGDWVTMDVYSDRDRKNKVGNGDMPVDLTPASGSYDTTFYVIIHQGPGSEYSDSINITVYPQSRLDIFYSPDIKAGSNTEYDIDDWITISIDTSEFKFNAYSFFLNNTNLNRTYLSGDTTKNAITVSVLAFSGVEDFIKIVATDQNKCITSIEDNVVVRVPFPSVFTPDGDGINDVFLGGEKFRNREFHLEVHNRWGHRLYYGESGWDGTYRGNKVPAGTYLYTLELKTENGSTKVIEGTVTLIRESSK
jgi:gliding motility-associated-like protein